MKRLVMTLLCLLVLSAGVMAESSRLLFEDDFATTDSLAKWDAQGFQIVNGALVAPKTDHAWAYIGFPTLEWVGDASVKALSMTIEFRPIVNEKGYVSFRVFDKWGDSYTATVWSKPQDNGLKYQLATRQNGAWKDLVATNSSVINTSDKWVTAHYLIKSDGTMTLSIDDTVVISYRFDKPIVAMLEKLGLYSRYAKCPFEFGKVSISVIE